jgi:hypothetical protein
MSSSVTTATPVTSHIPESEAATVTGLPRYLAEGKVGHPIRLKRTIGDIPAGTMGTVVDIGPGDRDTVGMLILGWHLPGAEDPLSAGRA